MSKLGARVTAEGQRGLGLSLHSFAHVSGHAGSGGVTLQCGVCGGEPKLSILDFSIPQCDFI